MTEYIRADTVAYVLRLDVGLRNERIRELTKLMQKLSDSKDAYQAAQIPSEPATETSFDDVGPGFYKVAWAPPVMGPEGDTWSQHYSVTGELNFCGAIQPTLGTIACFKPPGHIGLHWAVTTDGTNFVWDDTDV